MSADGVRVEATHLPGPGDPAGPALVVLHGFTGHRGKPANRAVVDGFAARLPVVALDLRGHGRSGGRTTLGHREVLDLDAGVRWARLLGYRQVVSVGFSMGASVVVRHAGLHGHADTGPDPVGVRETVDAAVAVSGTAFWFYRGTPAMRLLHTAVGTATGRAALSRLAGTRVDVSSWDAWESGDLPLSPEQAARLVAPTPLLVVHGDADHYFPLEHPRALAAAVREGAAERGVDPGASQLWIESGFGHAETAAAVAPELLGRICDWAREATS